MRHRVVALADIPPEGTLAVGLPSGRQLCLVRHAGGVSAFTDCCPHQGMPLSAGEVLPDGVLECAWHGARFDPATGAVRRGPAQDALECFAAEVVDGEVFVTEPE